VSSLYLTKKLQDSVTPEFRDYGILAFFVYDPILLKLSMNANIVKMQIFYKIKYDLRGHSRSQIMTFLNKNSPFLLFKLLIDWRNKCRWTLWKNKVWLIQRWYLPCFDLNLRSYGQLFVLVLLMATFNVNVDFISDFQRIIYRWYFYHSDRKR
jgi:hypothetical protein